MSNNELMHYGVLGMKWGKRKASYYTDKSNNVIRKMNSSKTWSGRTTTFGKRFVDLALTGGLLGTVKDVRYYMSSKR